jgi:hypothetical protein
LSTHIPTIASIETPPNFTMNLLWKYEALPKYKIQNKKILKGTVFAITLIKSEKRVFDNVLKRSN